MDGVLFSAILAGLAVFSLLMVIFEPWLFPPQPKLDAVRASVLSRERYERLVVAERPWWEQLLAPVAARLGSAMPALASQVSERDIVRAGFDPGTLTPAEVYAAKLVLGLAVLGIGVAFTPLFPFALILALPLAFVGYVFPTEHLGALGRRRKAQLLRELPDFLALVRPLSETPGLERAMATVADELHAASEGENLLARQVRSAIAAYGTGVNFYAALADVAAAADLEELDELASSLGQARRIGKGLPDVLAEHERSLRESERNRLLGAASTVQPKLAAILAAVYLPAFVVLIVVPFPSRRWGGSEGGGRMWDRERLRRTGAVFWRAMRDERGLTTLEYVIAAGIILVVLAAAIVAWNNGLAQRIGELVGQLLGQ